MGQPWFIHGVAFDITDLKKAEIALDDERNFVTAILDTVGALVVVLDPLGGIVRFNRACEETTGFTFEEVRHRRIWESVLSGTDRARSQEIFDGAAGWPHARAAMRADGRRATGATG